MARNRPRPTLAKRRVWEDRIAKRQEAIQKATEEFHKEVFRATEDGMSLADIGYVVGLAQSSIGKYRDKGRALAEGKTGE